MVGVGRFWWDGMGNRNNRKLRVNGDHFFYYLSYYRRKTESCDIGSWDMIHVPLNMVHNVKVISFYKKILIPHFVTVISFSMVFVNIKIHF